MIKIETSSLTKQVYDILRKSIISREYLPGDKLDILTLADTFGVSRSPVKDAINQLVHEGLIEVIPRKGTYVSQLSFNEFTDILDARLMIEKWAAEQIIESAAKRQIDECTEIVVNMDNLLDLSPFPFEEYLELDIRLHKTLVELANNANVKQIYNSLNTHVSLSRIVYSTSLESTIARHKDHWNLIKALKDRNLNAFTDTITMHIHSLKKEAKSRWDEVMDSNF
ncbi:GntR family transcriptional regulator [Sporosarcina pasteurii]|uniref:Uncharacterized HTH-type transcriptional regulator ydfH n=1 Tax=Sporosarcina pasteurii TaxID=1474 RepID=A0A380BFV3_SPOPA|nr:GntR family transcriptional regulator [Sporosarcina pasteurii]MDS9472478.1 GntR family transcriptional regulator [Sporosarcina pasteurii]QBQ06034.1 GntR family transcriptional regulator [Sporosarcina pasteurii]SUI99645.1 Uncharacterized HTH-type transcriptional regulator ydfH [Sporosarcina pasteurii]